MSGDRRELRIQETEIESGPDDALGSLSMYAFDWAYWSL